MAMEVLGKKTLPTVLGGWDLNPKPYSSTVHKIQSRIDRITCSSSNVVIFSLGIVMSPGPPAAVTPPDPIPTGNPPPPPLNTESFPRDEESTGSVPRRLPVIRSSH